MSDLGLAGLNLRQSILTGSLFALTGATAYGINIVGARVCAQLGITGSDVVVYRALLFVPLLAGFAWATGRRLVLNRQELPAVLRFAGCAVGTALCYMTALRYLSVPMAVTIFYTYPLIVILLTPYLDRVPLTMRRWIVALVAFAGVLLAVGPHAEAIDPRGVGFALLGSVFCAGMFITATRLTTSSVVTFFWCQLVALPLGLAFAWVTGGLSPPEHLATGILPLAITVGGYFLGFLFQILAASRISAASAGLLFLFEPVVAIVTAALVLGEHITPMQGAGMAMIIGALAFDMLPGLRSRRAGPLSDA